MSPLDVQEIATEKAGIFKGGSPALAIPQPEEAQLALQVLRPPHLLSH